MPAPDEKNETVNQVSTDDLLTNRVHRRNFLKFFAGAFAAAALPEALEACSGAPADFAEGAGSSVSFANVAMKWVTRKQDGLSLGFQFVGVGSDPTGGPNIVVSAPGNAYIAITFPPQHVIEDALPISTPPPVPPALPVAPTYPVKSYASGTSRLVFAVPTTYGTAVDAGGLGTFPYTLQGVLELCALCPPQVNPQAGAGTLPGPKHSIKVEEDEEDPYEGLSRARIDRVIARVDPKAAARVRRRALRAARMLNPEIQPIQRTTIPGGGPVMPGSGETSIELPFRVLISPDGETGWSFMSAPVTSPDVQGLSADTSRSELWHARMAHLNHAGLPDLSIPGLAVRALYTRDWDVYWNAPNGKPYGVYAGSGNLAGNGNLPEPPPANPPPPSPYANDPVALANPIAPNREALVLQSANTNLAPLNVNRLILSPAGGTLDAWADWSNTPANQGYGLSPAALKAWKQNTVLGRDEYVECVNEVTILPGGFPGVLTTINKRCDNPVLGTVGAIYSSTVLTITNPLVSFVGVGTPSDYNTFPFVALELTETKFPTNASPGTTTFALDANGQPLQVGMVGTDWKGNSIKFTTQILICPPAAGATSLQTWNAANLSYQMNGQRIAFAPPADGKGCAAGSYSPDSTSFQTTSFNIVMVPPKVPVSGETVAQLVPRATHIALVVEAVQHLQSSPSSNTSGAATYDYDLICYGPSGFGNVVPPGGGPALATMDNPNEIFLTLSVGVALAAPPPPPPPPAPGTTPPAPPPPSAAPAIDFTKNPAQSGGLAAPALAANALSRSRGVLSGNVAPATAPGNTPPAKPANSLYSGGVNPGDFFNGFNPQLFGFVPLQSIVKGLEGLAAQFMPKSVTKSLSDAEAFLEEAMGLYNLITNLASDSSADQSSQLQTLLAQLLEDVSTYSSLAQGQVPAGGAIAGGSTFAEGAPLTNAEMQAAAWLQSAVTQAQVLITQYVADLKGMGSAAVAVYNDVTSLTFDNLISTSLPALITGLNNFILPVESLLGSVSDDAGAAAGQQSAAGMVMKYFGPILNPIRSAITSINTILQDVSGVLGQIKTDLAILSQGLDLAKNMSVEFKWQPVITGLKAGGFVAFIPCTNQAFKLDVEIDATAHNGNPAGANITVRLDSFAICFGGSLPAADNGSTDFFVPVDPGYKQTVQNADVSLVFDHMQVQMLAGQKPDVDVVFSDIYFGGDLSFVESLKNLIPLDAFSDPPFVNVTTSGITAGFSLGLPNIAVGMFSIQNMNISASLTIPFISTSSGGITFEFDFCTIDNPFVVTVSMLGGGGFFSMWMDLNGLQGIALGIQVEAQLAIDLVVASGSISIEVGIFLVYWNPNDFTGGKDPVTGQDKEKGWLIGGYLRLRGELDVCGIITISVELYLQITYSPTTGKCIASGFISVDVSLFFFSIHAKVPFSRQFAGSNGDPTLAQMMSPGGVDPMIDPTLTSTSASAVWDPFAEYCMAYAS